MGKKDKNKKKGKGAEKTAMKTDKKSAAKQKKMLEKLGEADIAEVVAKLEQEEARLKIVTEEVCAPPSPRSSFSLVAHPEKEELILFGGEFFNGQRVCVYNDLFFYNIAKNEWKQVRSPSGPTPRSGHQMVAVAADGGQLWLFGGEHASPSQLQFYHYKDLWVMSLKTKSWQKVKAENGPSPRSGHRMVAAKKRLIVFGGFHDNNQAYRYFNDIHIFSLETYTWLPIEVSTAVMPPPRSGCCMAGCPDGKILVWGGYSKAQLKKGVDRGVTHTDMFALVPDKSKPNDKYKWTNVKASGYKPHPRSSVSCAISPNGKAYCFGGVMDIDEDEEDLHGQFGDELLSLDLGSTTWRVIEVSKKLKKEKKVSSVSMPDGEEMETSEPVASTPTVTTDGIFTVTVAGPSNSQSSALKMPSLFPNQEQKTLPSARMNPGLCICKGTLYLYGGLYEEDKKQFTYSDFYALDLHKLDEWKVLHTKDKNAHDWIDSESSDSEDADDSCEESDESDDDEDSDSQMETD